MVVSGGYSPHLTSHIKDLIAMSHKISLCKLSLASSRVSSVDQLECGGGMACTTVLHPLGQHVSLLAEQVQAVTGKMIVSGFPI